jgi:hypothetical protein
MNARSDKSLSRRFKTASTFREYLVALRARELVSRQFPESLGVLVKAFSKLLDHSVQYVRIVSGDGFGDEVFNAVFKASPGH